MMRIYVMRKWMIEISAVAAMQVIGTYAVAKPPLDPQVSILAKRFDLDAETTTVKGLLRKVTKGKVPSKLRDVETDTTWPFFVFFEGNESEYVMDNDGKSTSPMYIPPLVPAKPSGAYKVYAKSVSVREGLGQPIEKGNPELRTSLKDNVLMIQETKLANAPDWPLNGVVDEVKEKSLTYLEAASLLRNKYGWKQDPVDLSDPIVAERANDVVIERTDEIVSVRDLLLATLRQELVRAYPRTPDWIGAYQIIEFGRTLEGKREWTVLLLLR